MSHSNLTRWIETAEERRVAERAMLDRCRAADTPRVSHFAEALALMSFWFRGGCHARAVIARQRGKRSSLGFR